MFFVTQNPADLPEEVAGQLGNRVQHALRAFTRRDQRAIRAAAETFRINPSLDTESVITELRVGEALVSTLDEDGAPTVVQRTLIKPPRSRLGPITPAERASALAASPMAGKYGDPVDRESATEMLRAKADGAAVTAEELEGGDVAPSGDEAAGQSIWAQAFARGTKTALGSAAGKAGRTLAGKRSRANPVRSGVTSAAGSIATELAGPIAGRFVRNLVGGLMR